MDKKSTYPYIVEKCVAGFTFRTFNFDPGRITGRGIYDYNTCISCVGRKGRCEKEFAFRYFYPHFPFALALFQEKRKWK